MALLRSSFGLLTRSSIIGTSRSFSSTFATRSSETSSTDAPSTSSANETTEQHSSNKPSPSTSTFSTAPPSRPRSSKSAILDAMSERLKSDPKPAFQSRVRPPPKSWNNHFQTSMPGSRSSNGPRTPEENWSKSVPLSYPLPITTTSARSVQVRNGDVGRGFRILNQILRENNVRQELRRQERFEGPSDKRVRLNSERHRRRFKVEVGKQVGKALRLRERA